jgi:redox-sensitive bicupin YhaK (pirin superfamily)
MTAGAGILHIEKPPEALVLSGGLFHGIQLWVNLPRANKWNPPRYQDIRGREAALATTEDGGVLLRVIAGEVGGHRGPGSTFTPITFVHATISPTAAVELPWRADFNALVYVLAGKAEVGAKRHPVQTGQLAVFGAGDFIELSARRAQDGPGENLELLVLGGQPIKEPVVHYGPFVMNTREEIMQAMQDYQAGRLGTVPAQSMPHRHPGDLDPSSPSDEARRP